MLASTNITERPMFIAKTGILEKLTQSPSTVIMPNFDLGAKH